MGYGLSQAAVQEAMQKPRNTHEFMHNPLLHVVIEMRYAEIKANQ